MCDCQVFTTLPVRAYFDLKFNREVVRTSRLLTCEMRICLGCASQTLYDGADNSYTRGSAIKPKIQSILKKAKEDNK